MTGGVRPVSRSGLLVLTGAATFGALGVAVVAFIGSFQALAGFAVEVGVATTGDTWTSGNAWTWPVVIDVTILVATASWIARNLRGRETHYPLRVTFAFVAISVAVNAAHALDPLTGIPRAAAAMTLAALLPVALAVCVHLVVLELHDLLTPAVPADSAQRPASDRRKVAAGQAPRPARPDTPDRPATVPAPAADTGSDTHPDPAGDADTQARVTGPGVRAYGEPDTVDAVVAAHLSDGGQLADSALTAAVAVALGMTERTARRRLQPYRDGHIRPLPHPTAVRGDVA